MIDRLLRDLHSRQASRARVRRRRGARIGLQLPARMGWRDVIVIGVLASVGFTVALFFATAAVGPGPTFRSSRWVRS